jgi:hypothetical protein
VHAQAYKVEKFPKTLASELGLKESEYTTVIIIESTSHEKIREVRHVPPPTRTQLICVSVR